ncbi:hypothetical protein SASPL_141720 [Salvia splendens]|uniref:Secreted protein n=1 Tax=Salvia splendens TaxID=180675 RepID=A0A8X8Z8U6_SALSN|nr:hypothetical protein SASPL_141720 [Salvia splendens]
MFTCASFLLIGICFAAAGVWRRRKSEPCKEAVPRRSAAVEVLLGSVGWSRRRGSELEESRRPVAVVKREGQSHNSAVWQRPILMGGKCELPRFSGLILYDQRGSPLHQCQHEIMCKQVHRGPDLESGHEEMMSSPTTLRDLL